MGVEGVLHPGSERIDILLRGLGRARWRHQTSAQLAQGLFPDLRVIRRGLQVQAVERDAAALQARVVAADAVGIQHRAMWIRRGSGGRLPHGSVLQKRQRGDQNHHSARKNETLHILQPIALSKICSRMFIIRSHTLLAQKTLNCQGSPCGNTGGQRAYLKGRRSGGKWYSIKLKICSPLASPARRS